MARILVAAVPHVGHATPLRRIAVDLAARGHDVVFLSGPAFGDALAGTDVRFVALQGIADGSAERMAQIVAGRSEIPEGPAMLNYEFIKAFYEPIPDQFAAVQRILAEAPDATTIVITDQSFMGHWPLRFGAPGPRPRACIGIGTVPLSLNSIDTAPFGLGLAPDASPEGRARNAELNRSVEAMFAESTAVLKETLAGLGANTDEFPFPMDAIVSLPDLFLQLTVAEVEYPRSDAPAGLRYIGILPADPALPEELPSWWDEVTGARRVILVTQGTIANRDLGQLVAPALEALADLDALVVVTTGHSGAEVGAIPANARVADFIPYTALLPHLDAVVTNGGYGGCLLALAAGVPLVIAGRTEDKVEVSARLAWTGAAINLETSTPAPHEVRKAVDELLNNGAYRRNAQRLAASTARHDPFDAIAAAVAEFAPSDADAM
jgi:UDP:flavonoid glycosyltransferase YjiC (YdhE family)